MHRKETRPLPSIYPSQVQQRVGDDVNDETLVQYALLGDENAYSELFNRYKKKIYFICLQYSSGDHDVAYDCSQEAFISAFSNLENLRKKSQFFIWLIEIAKNKCISHARKLQTIDKVMREYQVIREADKNDKLIYSEAVYQVIEELIEGLGNEDLKNTIKMFYLEGKKTAEIAELQGISQTAVTTRLNRFRSTFRRRIIIEVLNQQESDS